MSSFTETLQEVGLGIVAIITILLLSETLLTAAIAVILDVTYSLKAKRKGVEKIASERRLIWPTYI